MLPLRLQIFCFIKIARPSDFLLGRDSGDGVFYPGPFFETTPLHALLNDWRLSFFPNPFPSSLRCGRSEAPFFKVLVLRSVGIRRGGSIPLLRRYGRTLPPSVFFLVTSPPLSVRVWQPFFFFFTQYSHRGQNLFRACLTSPRFFFLSRPKVGLFPLPLSVPSSTPGAPPFFFFFFFPPSESGVPFRGTLFVFRL